MKNPLKNIRTDFLGHLKKFYKVDRSSRNRRYLDYLQEIVNCLPPDLRENYWDLQLVALACSYLADGGRVEDLYRYGFSIRMVNAVRLLTPCYSPDEPEDGPGHLQYMLRLLRSPTASVVRFAMIAAARKVAPVPGVEVPSEGMLELFRGLADGELRFTRQTPFFGQFADFELGDRDYGDVRRDVCKRALRAGPFLEMLLATDDFPLVFDSETDRKWGRNRQGEGWNELGGILKSVFLIATQSFPIHWWHPYAEESQEGIWARAGWWHKIKLVSDWVRLLAENPKEEYARHCPFGRFSALDWADLLRWQPEFFDICRLWRKKASDFWAAVACLMPNRVEERHWDCLRPDQWFDVLALHPELSSRAPWPELEANHEDEAFVRGWATLLVWQPHFAPHCHVWARMSEFERADISVMRPEFHAELEKIKPLSRFGVDRFYANVRSRNERLNRYWNENDLSTKCVPGYFDDTDCRSLVWFAWRRPILYRYCLKRVARELPWGGGCCIVRRRCTPNARKTFGKGRKG